MAVPFNPSEFRQQASGQQAVRQAPPTAPMRSQPPMAPQGQPQPYHPPQAHQPAPPPHPQHAQVQGQPQQTYAPRPYPQTQIPQMQQTQMQPQQMPGQAAATMQQPYTQPPLQSAPNQMPQQHMPQSNTPLQPRMFTPPPSSKAEAEIEVPGKKRFSLKRKRRAQDKATAPAETGQPIPADTHAMPMVHMAAGNNMVADNIENAVISPPKAGRPPALVFAAGLAVGVIGTFLGMSVMGNIMGSKLDQRFEEVAAAVSTEVPAELVVTEAEASQDLSNLKDQLKTAEALKTP